MICLGYSEPGVGSGGWGVRAALVTLRVTKDSGVK